MRDDSLSHETTKVGDIVAGDYRTAAVFEKHGIDFCCGGAVTLAAACADKGHRPVRPGTRARGGHERRPRDRTRTTGAGP